MGRGAALPGAGLRHHHHPREPLEREGGTTFHFVTDGVEAAYERAREAAGEGDVRLGGGADVAQQCLRVGLVEEMELHVVPSCSAPASGFSRVWATPGSSSP